MLTLLSPAKTLDWSPAPDDLPTTKPLLRKDTKLLIDRCKKLDVAALRSLMKLSEPLAELNHERFQEMTARFSKKNSRPCLLAFKGDVYRGLDAASLSNKDLLWAQKHLRIISGLYGVLRPLDLMQPYRLEMGTRLDTDRGKTLYAFWGERIADSLDHEVEKTGGQAAVLNLASQEYSKAVPARSLSVPIVSAHFKEYRNGDLKTIAFSAKKARGLMARFIVANRIDNPKDVRAFAEAGYRFDPRLSSTETLTFTRKQPAK